MRRAFTIIIFNLLLLRLYSQSVIDFSKFPVGQKDNKPILTTDLLEKLNWGSIKKFCDTAKGHYAYISHDSLTTVYEYVEQGYVASFKIIDYKGMVLQYNSEVTNSSQPSNVSYFDKNIWMMYVNEMLPNLPEQFKLTIEEPQELLKAYYRLLGIDTRDEYGWICEYSTIGKATERRMAVIELIRYHRSDLLKKIINYPNLQTQLYVIDALVYLDYETKNKFKPAQIELKQQQARLDSLRNLENVDKNEIESVKMEIKSSKALITYLDSGVLTKKDWKTIYDFRDSNQIIRTCGNAGSYKVYQTPTPELLSDKAIAEIPKHYESLKKLGYFK